MEIGLCTYTSMSMHVPAFVKSRYLQWKQSPLTNTTFIFAWLCEEFKNHCGSVPLFGEKTRCDQQHRNAIVHREASSGWPGNCTCFNDTLHAECQGRCKHKMSHNFVPWKFCRVCSWFAVGHERKDGTVNVLHKRIRDLRTARKRVSERTWDSKRRKQFKWHPKSIRYFWAASQRRSGSHIFDGWVHHDTMSSTCKPNRYWQKCFIFARN